MTLHKITTYSNDAKLALSLLSRTPISVEDGAYQRAAKAVWAYGLVRSCLGRFGLGCGSYAQ